MNSSNAAMSCCSSCDRSLVAGSPDKNAVHTLNTPLLTCITKSKELAKQKITKKLRKQYKLVIFPLLNKGEALPEQPHFLGVSFASFEALVVDHLQNSVVLLVHFSMQLFLFQSFRLHSQEERNEPSV
jgi:hypothetical protein